MNRPKAKCLIRNGLNSMVKKLYFYIKREEKKMD